MFSRRLLWWSFIFMSSCIKCANYAYSLSYRVLCQKRLFLHYRCLHTLEVDLQVFCDATTRVREVVVLGVNLANMSSLAPSPHHICGAMGSATGMAGVSFLANEPVRPAVRGPGDVNLSSRGTSDVRLLVLTDDHWAAGWNKDQLLVLAHLISFNSSC